LSASSENSVLIVTGPPGVGKTTAAALLAARSGYRTIVDGIVIPGWFFEPLRDTLREEGHAVSYAVLRAPLDVCLARVQGREGEPSVEAAAIEQLWRSFADLGDLERHVLEVDGMAPGRVSDELAERLSGGSLRA
jgi:predicted kinase